MKKIILIALIALQAGCLPQCEKDKPKLTPQQMILNIKNAGTDELPISNDVKNRIDESLKHLTEEKSQELTNKHDPSSLVSTDCKTWKNPKEDSEEDFPYLKKTSDTPPALIDEKNSLLFYTDSSFDPYYHRIYDNAVLMLMGEKHIKYRRIKPQVLEKGLSGILQSQLLIAIENDQWSFGFSKNGEPVAILINPGQDTKALVSYSSITCTKTYCVLVGSPPKDLVVGSPEAIFLKEKQLFSEPKLQALIKTCSAITSEKTIQDYNETLNSYEKACGIKTRIKMDFESYKKHCKSLEAQIIPLMRTFQ